MKEFFKHYNLRQSSLAMIDEANRIIEALKDEGYTPTLRQLYYQLVTENIIPNEERSYKNLSKLVTKGREAGLISWLGIEDRGRGSKDYYVNEDIYQLFEGLGGFFAYDMWAKQETYVEVWVEKDALVNVVARPCERYKTPYMACKGYLSASEAWRSGQRYRAAAEAGKRCVLIHLGDHDPSGIDMTRDNGERLELFSGESVEVQRIALTKEQIEEYGPPSNPAKFDDPRATDYIAEHGMVSWELDALKPKVLDKLIADNIKKFIDFSIWDPMQAEQEKIRTKIRKLPDLHDEIFDLVEQYMEDEEE